MGTYNAVYSIAYQNDILMGSPVQGPFVHTLDDGDADSTFETGDVVQHFGADYSYEGTVMVDGSLYPLFTYVPDPQFKVIYMDQEPVSPPPTVSGNGVSISVACFAADTLIETAEGSRQVQDLVTGDAVLTADGKEVRVKWVGRQTFMPMFGTAKRNRIVEIKAGALGGGLPHTDLRLTADHGMIIDGLVINAGALVNDDTIRIVSPRELEQRYTVYHIETENHDVILANGAPSETFVDYLGRQAFDNYQEYVDLYGEQQAIQELPIPRISTQRMLPVSLKDRLGIEDLTNMEEEKAIFA